MQLSRLEQICLERGVRMTEQRRIIVKVLSSSDDHPDVEQVHVRASAIDPGISIATVYRTVRLLEEAGALEKHDFREGRARYEEATDTPHDHLIDLKTGAVIEFQNTEIEELQHKIAKELGYVLVGRRLELYGVPIEKETDVVD